MRLLTNNLGPFKPAVHTAFSYYNSPYTLHTSSTLRVAPDSTYAACIINLDRIAPAQHLTTIKRLAAGHIVIGIVSSFNQSQCLYWLSEGLHDCFVYPFKPEELRLKLARFLALQQSAPQPPPQHIPTAKGKEQLDSRLFLDHRVHLLVKDNVGVYLTSREYRVVQSLYTRRNQLLSFQQIAHLLDPTAQEPEPSPNLISSYISQIRKKAKQIKANLTIKSVYGYGYYVEAAGRADFSAT